MHEQNRYAVLICDKMSLSKGFHYEAHKQTISGYEDLGELGRTANAANHALVFMIRDTEIMEANGSLLFYGRYNIL